MQRTTGSSGARFLANIESGIGQYGSLKTDPPNPPSQGGDKNALKVPLLKGDLGGSPGHKYVK